MYPCHQRHQPSTLTNWAISPPPHTFNPDLLDLQWFEQFASFNSNILIPAQPRTICGWWILAFYAAEGRDVEYAVEHLTVKVGIIRLSLYGRYICCLGHFPFQPVVHNWSSIGCGNVLFCLGISIEKIPCYLSKRVAYLATTVGFL